MIHRHSRRVVRCPADNAVEVPFNTVLHWVASDPQGQPLEYDVYLGANSDPPLHAHATAPQVFVSLSEQHYYWRVVAIDPAGQRTSSPTWQFFTGTTQGPTVPSLVSPANGASVSPSGGVLLDWDSNDPQGLPLAYDVYLGTTTTPALLQSVSESRLLYAAGENTTYHWRVVARDVDGHETVGPLWDFTTTGNHPPLVPFNPAPADTAIDVSRTPTLTWECSDPDGDALTYYVYFCDWYIPPYVATVTTREFTPAGPLLRGATYYWKIVAVDAGGATSTGPVWSFRTSTTDVPPSGDVNADGAVTVADAQCALEAYLYAPIVLPSACGGAGGALRGDVDCSNVPTPADAYCIFRSWLDKSCSFCAGSANTVLRQAGPAPRLALRVLRENEDVVVVLQVSGVPSVARLVSRCGIRMASIWCVSSHRARMCLPRSRRARLRRGAYASVRTRTALRFPSAMETCWPSGCTGARHRATSA